MLIIFWREESIFLVLAWWLSWLNSDNPFFGHQKEVYSVQFNGLGDMAVSGSQDQNIIRWRTAGFTNPFINQEEGKVASSPVISHWAAPNTPNAALMTEFYRALQSSPDKATALRQAMLATKKQYPHPKNWAGFSLIGSPR